jgi:hypothetical protein
MDKLQHRTPRMDELTNRLPRNGEFVWRRGTQLLRMESSEIILSGLEKAKRHFTTKNYATLLADGEFS